MAATTRRRTGNKSEETRRKIKRAALQLFAQRSFEDVSVREITRAAGQKNTGSINYHFSGRADLVAELVRDVAGMLDDHFARRLDAMEAAGGPHSIREVAEILIDAPTLSGPETDTDDQSLRFFNNVLINHRDLLFEAMRDRDRGTRRCLAHMRRLAPEMPPDLLRQRLMLVVNYLTGVASSREAARADRKTWEKLWGHPASRANLADTVVGMLCQPPSPETLDRLDGADEAARAVIPAAG